MRCKVLVHAHRHLSCCNIETIVLEHFLLFVVVCDLVTDSLYIKFQVILKLEIIQLHHPYSPLYIYLHLS